MVYNRVVRKLAMAAYNNDNGIMADNVYANNPNPGLGFLEYLGEAVLVVDNSRIIRAVNSSLERLLGWRADELIGKACYTVFDCQHPTSETPLCENLCPLLLFYSKMEQNKGGYYQDLSLRTKNGERREVSASFAPLEIPFLTPPQTDGAIPALPAYNIIALRDITDQKRQERIKTQFIATASHQLRTPLASIKTAIGLLLANIDSDFSPPLLRLLQNIQSSSLRMERLVNDLIELTNLQSGRVQMQQTRVEAGELVQMAVKFTHERLEARQQTLLIKLPDVPLYVVADTGRISQVLGHLISNASKFSPTSKNIELSVKAVEASHGKEVVFSVRDEGIGIAEDEQGLIFEKFYQSLVTENSAEIGNGLGLPLAKALIELNNGRLWFESKQGVGSTFSFALPAS